MWKGFKRWLKLIGITLAVMALPFGAFVWWRWEMIAPYVQSRAREYQREYKSHALTKAMDRQVKNLPTVDSVKLWRLSESATAGGQEPFTRDIHGGKLYEVQSNELQGIAAQQFADVWRKQSVFDNGVMCHEPHHAVIFYHHGREVGRALICFTCTNAVIPSSILGDDLIGFDDATIEYAELKRLIESLVGTVK
jgi:hypothetical protein